MRANLQNLFHSKCYNVGITLIILLNCLVLGLDTSEGVRSACGAWLRAVDSACLGVFVVELLLKIYAFKLAFFTGKDKGWNAFDFIIVAVSLLGASGISVLRALRVFRALRLLSTLPQIRLVTEAMLHTLPSLLGVAILLFIFGSIKLNRIFSYQF